MRVGGSVSSLDCKAPGAPGAQSARGASLSPGAWRSVAFRGGSDRLVSGCVKEMDLGPWTTGEVKPVAQWASAFPGRSLGVFSPSGRLAVAPPLSCSEPPFCPALPRVDGGDVRRGPDGRPRVAERVRGRGGPRGSSQGPGRLRTHGGRRRHRGWAEPARALAGRVVARYSVPEAKRWVVKLERPEDAKLGIDIKARRCTESALSPGGWVWCAHSARERLPLLARGSADWPVAPPTGAAGARREQIPPRQPAGLFTGPPATRRLALAGSGRGPPPFAAVRVTRLASSPPPGSLRGDARLRARVHHGDRRRPRGRGPAGGCSHGAARTPRSRRQVVVGAASEDPPGAWTRG